MISWLEERDDMQALRSEKNKRKEKESAAWAAAALLAGLAGPRVPFAGCARGVAWLGRTRLVRSGGRFLFFYFLF
jgi:hypothetical protein